MLLSAFQGSVQLTQRKQHQAIMAAGIWFSVCVCLHIKVKHNMAIVLQDYSSWMCHTTDAGVHAARRACVPERLVLNVERAVVNVG